MTVSADQVKRAYAGLRRAKIAAFDAGEEEIVAKAEYETARIAGITAGTITGRNDTERDAAAKTACADEWMHYQMAVAEAREARHHLDLAQSNVDESRALLRLEELAGFAGSGIIPPSHNREA
jgi:hypothetical protein